MAANIPYRPELTVVGNGVSLLNAPSSSRNSGVFLIVRAGSRDESAETSGLAHYLEHMFFKGTERRPTTKIISRGIDRRGANTNAYTDTEEVAYFAEGPATAMLELADVICDMLSRPLFAAEEVERERNVVLQELSMRLARPAAAPRRLDLGPSRTRCVRRRPADVLVRRRVSRGHREGDARAAHRVPPGVLFAGIDVPGRGGVPASARGTQ